MNSYKTMVAQMALTQPSGWQNCKDMNMKERFVGRMQGWCVWEYERTNAINKQKNQEKTKAIQLQGNEF